MSLSQFALSLSLSLSLSMPPFVIFLALDKHIIKENDCYLTHASLLEKQYKKEKHKPISIPFQFLSSGKAV